MDSQTKGTSLGQVGSNAPLTPAKVVPLLQQLGRVEELTSAMVVRLDPITNHEPQNSDAKPAAMTVTGRITALGDSLQYLLDHIEL